MLENVLIIVIVIYLIIPDNIVSNCYVLMYVIVSLSQVNERKWLRSRGGAL